MISHWIFCHLEKKRKGHHLYKWHFSDLSIFKRVYYSLATEFILLCKQVCASLCVYVSVYMHVYICWQEHACLYFHKLCGHIFFQLVIFCLNILIAKESTVSSQKNQIKILTDNIKFISQLYYIIILFYIWRVRFQKTRHAKK